MKKSILFFLFIFLSNYQVSFAQELLFDVRVNAENIETSDKQIFQDMERNITEFLNQTNWTDLEYKQQEKIKCNFIINVQEMPSIGKFKATATIQASRPVYNTDYDTPLFYVFADKEWLFDYSNSQPIQFIENSFSDNLSALLSYYSLLIIGMDQDSFGAESGTPYLEKARQVMLSAQGTSFPGWRNDSPSNRFWIVDDLLNNNFNDFRQGIYSYHRKGLDLFTEKPDEARKNILNFLKKLEKIKNQRPSSPVLRNFFLSKNDELSNIFSKGDMKIRKESYEILTKLNPAEMDKYKKILDK